MVSVKVASVAGAVALFATVANAADMPGLPPMYMPPVEEFSASGWYLRGDIGMTNQQFKGLHQRLYDVPGTTVEATVERLDPQVSQCGRIESTVWYRIDQAPDGTIVLGVRGAGLAPVVRVYRVGRNGRRLGRTANPGEEER